MKKYVVKIKRNGHTFGEYKSPEEASEKLMEYIKHFNERSDGDGYISRFDFSIEEVECKEVNEVITDFEAARKVLGIKPNDEFTVVRTEHSNIEFDDVTRLVQSLNPSHIEALIALNELFTIAQAWNKEDGFVPDFSDWNQNKWFPWFKYDKDAAGFVFAYTFNSSTFADAYFGSRLCFKSKSRAEQFGKQFEELYNKVFL